VSSTTTTRRPSGGAGPRPLAAALREALILTAVAAVTTAVAWGLRSDRLPLRADPAYYELELAAPLVDPAAALDLYDEGNHLFVDTRPDAATTIPGAFRVREATFDDDLLANFDFLTPSDPLVVFGDGSLAAASNVAGRLKDRGYADVVILAGGLEAWRRQGGPLVSREEQP
jgi:rhodanese-related sulfurtransferase